MEDMLKSKRYCLTFKKSACSTCSFSHYSQIAMLFNSHRVGKNTSG